MNKLQKSNDSECHAPSSEAFSFYQFNLADTIRVLQMKLSVRSEADATFQQSPLFRTLVLNIPHASAAFMLRFKDVRM
jgi:hypothetical protein